MKRTVVLLVSLGFVAWLGACGDDERDTDISTVNEGTNPQSTDSETLTGEGEGEGEGEMLGGCDAVPSFFDEAGAYVRSHSTGKVIQYTGFDGLVEGHASAEAVLDMTLWSGLGVPLQPGTVNLGGDNASFVTCAACVRFQQGVTMNGQGVATAVEHEFMPTSGSLVIEALEPQVGGLFKFALDAEMIEVTIDDQTYETLPVGDGCSFSFVGYVATSTLK